MVDDNRDSREKLDLHTYEVADDAALPLIWPPCASAFMVLDLIMLLVPVILLARVDFVSCRYEF